VGAAGGGGGGGVVDPRKPPLGTPLVVNEKDVDLKSGVTCSNH